MYIWLISQLQQMVSWNQKVMNTLNEGIGKVVLPQVDGTVLCMEKTLNFLSLREWIRGFYDLLRDILTTMCVAHCVGFPYKLVLVPGLCGQCGMTKVWHFAAAADFSSLYSLMCSLILLSVGQRCTQYTTSYTHRDCYVHLVFSGPCCCSYIACLASSGRCILDRPVFLSRSGLTATTITSFCTNSRNQQWHNTALAWVIAFWSRNPSTGTYSYRK